MTKLLNLQAMATQNGTRHAVPPQSSSISIACCNG
ncbi:hypothetical protein J3R08_003326 [Micromonospora sp. HB375]|uniref:SapB/AmfS family lantipeptide n=1 Tax=Micromonospora echinospora TaxID=1877 RepID=A0ABR6MHC3_MICEC|nr:hypothetical protein MicB006_2253 [Micromonospora sp. B006]MBB5114065.1 hypothetical protein [Micromonospora echinospora]MBP1783476.1 hypothetical protein [Micromonospora sp. HB375]MDH6469125.1 hypothetical protein [Micromonospora sp. H404/HB375]